MNYWGIVFCLFFCGQTSGIYVCLSLLILGNNCTHADTSCDNENILLIKSCEGEIVTVHFWHLLSKFFDNLFLFNSSYLPLDMPFLKYDFILMCHMADNLVAFWNDPDITISCSNFAKLCQIIKFQWQPDFFFSHFTPNLLRLKLLGATKLTGYFSELSFIFQPAQLSDVCTQQSSAWIQYLAFIFIFFLFFVFCFEVPKQKALGYSHPSTLSACYSIQTSSFCYWCLNPVCSNIMFFPVRHVFLVSTKKGQFSYCFL